MCVLIANAPFILAFNRRAEEFVVYANYLSAKDISGRSEAMVESGIGIAIIQQEIQILVKRKAYFSHGKPIQCVVRTRNIHPPREGWKSKVL